MIRMTPQEDGFWDERVQIRVLMTRDVFVAGGTPTATYNPRQARRIEQSLERFLESTGKALTIYGPSKSGKTSLVERKLPKAEHVWLWGQDIRTIDDFWSQIAGQIGVPVSQTTGTAAESSQENSYGMGIGVPKLANAEFGAKEAYKSTNKDESTSHIHLAQRVRATLATNRTPVIIDDFHWMPDSIKTEVARAIKSIIRDSPMILIAVPSEAFEIVASEPEMNMRVWSIQIPPWEVEELTKIAVDGFGLLNLVDPGNAAGNQLATLSYASPYIMQQLCFDLVRWEMNIEETVPVEAPRTVELPEDIDTFLVESAERAQWAILPKLLAGPAGTNRQILTLKDDGRETDIYGAVLLALKNLTPPLTHSEREIYLAVNRLLKSPVQSPQVTNALTGMHNIAEREKGDSEPILRRRDGKLFIEDSGFAFYLNHGPWSPEKSHH